MIVNFRVDERLVHGQIVSTWLKYLDISHMIVANDMAAKDELQKISLTMAIPSNIKCLITNVDAAIRVLSDPRSKDKKILVICGNFSDVLKIITKIKDIREINVANYGKLTNVNSNNKQVVSRALILGDEDKENIKKIAAMGVLVIHQPLPSSPKKNLNNV